MTTTKSSVQTQVPDAGTPIFDSQGYINTVWHQFFFMLLRRTGGTAGVDTGSEAERLDAVEARVSDTEQEISAYTPIIAKPQAAFPEPVQVRQPPPAPSEGMVFTHGLQSDPALHALVTQTTDGFMAAGDKAKLDGVATGATSVTILGPVSQAGGVPTGAVMSDTVDATTGHRILKLASGWCQVTGLLPTTALLANGTAPCLVTLPASTFTSITFASGNATPSASADFYGCIYVNIVSVTDARFLVRNGATAQNALGTFLVIGRWF